MKILRKRSIAKTFTWRCLATTDTFIIGYFITGDLISATSIAGIEIFTKILIYYFHERTWAKVNWGTVSDLNPLLTQAIEITKETRK